MGTSWSEEANHTSQAQPIARSDSANYTSQVQPAAHSDSESSASRKSAKTAVPPSANLSVHNNKPKNNQDQKSVKLPHNCETILKDADLVIDKSSIEKLYQQLHAGVFLNGRKKKYWVEKRANINCFMVFANGLTITWGDTPNHWNLYSLDTSDHGKITIAQLRGVCWLEVHGRLDTTNLTPGVTYQVTYIIMIEQASFGWEVPINFRLTLPNGTKQEHQEKLNEKPKGDWVRIPVGEFKVSPEQLGEIEFSIYEYEGGNWKKGLLVKGVIVEPSFRLS